MSDASATVLVSQNSTQTSWMALAYETYGYYTVWWWEVFEMNRKLMLAGEGVQQTRWRVDLPWSAWG